MKNKKGESAVKVVAAVCYTCGQKRGKLRCSLKIVPRKYGMNSKRGSSVERCWQEEMETVRTVTYNDQTSKHMCAVNSHVRQMFTFFFFFSVTSSPSR